MKTLIKITKSRLYTRPAYIRPDGVAVPDWRPLIGVRLFNGREHVFSVGAVWGAVARVCWALGMVTFAASVVVFCHNPSGAGVPFCWGAAVLFLVAGAVADEAAGGC